MNKRQLSRIISLYRDGVSPEVCTSTIIEMSLTTIEASIFINKFFTQTVLDAFKRENQQLKEIIRGYQYEQSPDRTQPTELAD